MRISQSRRRRTVAKTADTAELCELCLNAPRSGVALVPRGHSRFCGTCADTVAAMNSGCQICRSPLTIVLRLFNERTVEQHYCERFLVYAAGFV